MMFDRGKRGPYKAPHTATAATENEAKATETNAKNAGSEVEAIFDIVVC
jgi:hypothetical protein